MTQKTYNALMARGFDSKTAYRISEDGYTLNDLKTLDINQLQLLNIPKESIDIILRENRPPIPPKTLDATR